jgi:formylglycine-generating enzyme required for sulfatase activity
MKPEQKGKVSIFVVGAALLLISEHEGGLLQTLRGSAAGQSAFEAGQVFRDRMENGTDGPEMVVIPAGKFRMGDTQGNGAKDEQPVHEVHIRGRIAVSRYEITFDQYDAFAKAAGRDLPDDEGWGRGRRPVVRVSWDDAVAYARWLSQQTGKHYRLPSEAEWEYAARAGTETTYWWGNEIKQGLANCIGCGSRWDNQQTAPVGSFKPNPFGLYDTAGNVSEWVQDCWHDSYQGAPSDGSA